ncbi:hypothetical protein DFH08DRAFT_1077670 [Mycena albidolilacea]|uniref:Uncharacterized protein n=1 Tax=Mycena albidolilacea TaxID=1033008 RepID=A0AAD7ABE4_9AGAR|nr:hypothetical protein DFH08DRAFT_1077670 [Mycena albidolilacea]
MSFFLSLTLYAIGPVVGYILRGFQSMLAERTERIPAKNKENLKKRPKTATRVGQGDSNPVSLPPSLGDSDASSGVILDPATPQEAQVRQLASSKLHTRKSPFCDLKHDVEATTKVVEGDRPLQPENMTDNLWDLVGGAWKEKAFDRLTIETIIVRMKVILGAVDASLN